MQSSSTTYRGFVSSLTRKPGFSGSTFCTQKLGREAEQQIARARREFREQFNQAVVAHTTGADRGDANARPHVVGHVSVGDTVQLKSLGRPSIELLRYYNLHETKARRLGLPHLRQGQEGLQEPHSLAQVATPDKSG